MFAILEIQGSQYKVEVGDKLEVNLMEAKEGETVKFDKVLLISDKDTKVGTPYLDGAVVEAKVLGNKRGEKIHVFKMKSKKRFRKTQGYRSDLTMLEITKIK